MDQGDGGKGEDLVLEIEAVKNYYKFIKLMNKIRKKIVSEKNVILILKECESQIIEIKDALSNNTKYTQGIIRRLKYFLFESTYKQSSALYRYILTNIFKVENLPSDSKIISSSLTYDDIPKVFDDEEIYLLENYRTDTGELEMKALGTLLTKYESMYGIDPDLTMKNLNTLGSNYGRILLQEWFMFWFPKYFEKYSETIDTLFMKDEFLPTSWRFYIALMAASTMRCDYIMRTLEDAYLFHGGDESWLIHGLNFVDKKLQNLGKINNILAHQPWKIQGNDLSEITQIVNSSDHSNWNLNELAHACLILVTFHQLSTIIEVLNLSVDEVSPQELALKTKIIEERINREREIELKSKQEIYENLEKFSKAEKKKKAKEGSDSAYNSESEDSSAKLEREKKYHEFDYEKYISKYCTVYHDFDAYSDKMVNYMDFNWEDNGIYIMNEFNVQGVDKVNDEITYILELTSNSVGIENKKYNSYVIRNCIKHYVEKIFGFHNDEFDYREVNKLLTRKQKTFVKNIVTNPRNITSADFEILKMFYKPEELFHIILFATNVKKRIQLTYLSMKFNDLYKEIK